MDLLILGNVHEMSTCLLVEGRERERETERVNKCQGGWSRDKDRENSHQLVCYERVFSLGLNHGAPNLRYVRSILEFACFCFPMLSYISTQSDRFIQVYDALTTVYSTVHYLDDLQLNES